MNLGLGQTIGGRYTIISQLGQGGFGKTFVAQDKHLPDHQQCVVKQLKPQATDPFTLQTARRLFDTEAKVLHRLGSHDQIPQLFAYFEENQEFYLVQEFIEGDDLSKELTPPTPPYQGGATTGNASSYQGGGRGGLWSEDEVISLLKEILEILDFVHQQNVIHRDINPRNIIRRKQDGKLVLIDFGAVKQVSTQVVQGGRTNVTVAIGTPGYLPSEQANSNPKLSSDIYAVGMVGIQALTGISPEQLPINPDTGELSWNEKASASSEFAEVLDKMVRYDFRQRYQSAALALQALNELKTVSKSTVSFPAASPKPISAKPKLSKSLLYKVLISMGVLSLGLAATVLIVNFVNSSNATELYKRGDTLLELKRYDDALASYNRAVELKPEYAEAWKGKGSTLLALKRYEEARNAYDKAIQIQPAYSEAWIGRGNALDSLQQYKEAINSFDRAIEFQSDSLEAWNSKGNVQIKLQQYSDAIASFDKAIQLQPKYAPTWNNRGWALHNLRQYEEAVKSYDKAVEYQPDFPHAWYQRGNALINLKKYEEAVESYDKTVQFQPNFSKAWYSRGSALINLRQYEQASASFDQAVKFNPDDSEAWYNRGWSLHQLQRYQEAVASYSKAIRLRRNFYQAQYNLGNAFYNLKRYQDAFVSYSRVVEIQPNHYEAWFSRGNALVNLKRYQDAIESYDKALQYKPDYQAAKDARNQAQSQLDAVPKKPEGQKQQGEAKN
ncbi:tetratricopeptide repeat protein [Microcoleus sp. ZQ-A2]|nr:tetratricopeptide repeat protein [Microcoleus sp. FACHB-1]